MVTARAKDCNAHSTDRGKTWRVEPFLFEPGYEFEEGFQYRSTLLKTNSNPHEYKIWYSAANRRCMFSVAYLQMRREKDTLRPLQG